jgi:hypothetical protein
MNINHSSRTCCTLLTSEAQQTNPLATRRYTKYQIVCGIARSPWAMTRSHMARQRVQLHPELRRVPPDLRNARHKQVPPQQYFSAGHNTVPLFITSAGPDVIYHCPKARQTHMHARCERSYNPAVRLAINVRHAGC